MSERKMTRQSCRQARVLTLRSVSHQQPAPSQQPPPKLCAIAVKGCFNCTWPTLLRPRLHKFVCTFRVHDLLIGKAREIDSPVRPQHCLASHTLGSQRGTRSRQPPVLSIVTVEEHEWKQESPHGWLMRSSLPQRHHSKGPLTSVGSTMPTHY